MTTKITEQNISNIRNAGVQWQSPKTANFDAVAGEGYFVNTSGFHTAVNYGDDHRYHIVGVRYESSIDRTH